MNGLYLDDLVLLPFFPPLLSRQFRIFLVGQSGLFCTGFIGPMDWLPGCVVSLSVPVICVAYLERPRQANQSLSKSKGVDVGVFVEWLVMLNKRKVVKICRKIMG